MSQYYKNILFLLLGVVSCAGPAHLHAIGHTGRQAVEESRKGRGYVLQMDSEKEAEAPGKDSRLSNNYLLSTAKILDAHDAPSKPLQEHYTAGIEALRNKDWAQAAAEFRIVAANWSETAYGQDSRYYLALSYFQQGKIPLADEHVAKYLDTPGNLKFFEESFRLKMGIAYCYSRGIKKHMFGMNTLPACISAKEDALRIYDEVISAFPNHPMTAKAYLAKGDMLRRRKQYRESIDCYQQVVKRFPKDEKAPIAFLSIAKVYEIQSKKEHQNPDNLALAELNLQRFEEQFPRDERLPYVRSKLAAMRDVYARSLYETGQFYERIKQPQASVIYYSCAIQKYPESAVAAECRQKLDGLQEVAAKLDIKILKGQI